MRTRVADGQLLFSLDQLPLLTIDRPFLVTVATLLMKCYMNTGNLHQKGGGKYAVVNGLFKTLEWLCMVTKKKDSTYFSFTNLTYINCFVKLFKYKRNLRFPTPKLKMAKFCPSLHALKL